MTQSTYLNIECISSDSHIQEMCQMYWELKPNHDTAFEYTLAALCQKFEVTTHRLKKLIAHHCIARLLEYRCNECGRGHRVRSRLEYKMHLNALRNGTVTIDDLTCEGCSDDEATSRVLAEAALAGRRIPVDIEAISLETAIFLMSFIRASANEYFTNGMLLSFELEEPTQRLAPTNQLCLEITVALLEEQYIYPQPANSRAYLSVSSASNLIWLTDIAVLWLPLGGTDNTEKGLFDELSHRFQVIDWPAPWYEEVKSVWMKIALHECIEFLLVCLERYQLPFTPGDKTLILFENLLNRWSVAQIYNFIWRATKDAAAYSTQSGISKPQAANWVIGGIQRIVDRATGEEWEIKPFQRSGSCHQSIISSVFFNTVMHIGERGFLSIPANSLPRNLEETA